MPVALDWYAGRRVFVTGHTGFKGAWLSCWLKLLGADVTGYALAPEGRSLFDEASVADGMVSIVADVRDRPRLDAALRDAAPDIVFHMAAQSLVRRSYDAPVETFETNVIGTTNLLDAVRRLPSVHAVVVITSDKCYENTGQDAPFAEDAPMGGHDPYSASKGCTELVAAAFARSFFQAGGCTITRARAGNVIGGGDWATDRIIPDLARAVMGGTSVNIRNPHAIRPWQHVLDPLYGYLLLGQRAAEQGAAFAGGWNFGPSEADAISVRDLVELLRAKWPAIDPAWGGDPAGPHEATVLRLDCRKAHEQLGWQPNLRLSDALDMTAIWYNAALADAGAVPRITTDQIAAYQAGLHARHKEPAA